MLSSVLVHIADSLGLLDGVRYRLASFVLYMPFLRYFLSHIYKVDMHRLPRIAAEFSFSIFLSTESSLLSRMLIRVTGCPSLRLCKLPPV